MSDDKSRDLLERCLPFLEAGPHHVYGSTPMRLLDEVRAFLEGEGTIGHEFVAGPAGSHNGDRDLCCQGMPVLLCCQPRSRHRPVQEKE